MTEATLSKNVYYCTIVRFKFVLNKRFSIVCSARNSSTEILQQKVNNVSNCSINVLFYG